MYFQKFQKLKYKFLFLDVLLDVLSSIVRYFAPESKYSETPVTINGEQSILLT